MYTTFRTKQGQEHKIVTQQYLVGLYIIVDNDPSSQNTSTLPEQDYHKKLRLKVLSNGDTLVSGSLLTIKSKTQDLNKFEMA